MIRLIVGLGNPGKEYQHTRHNVGAWFVQTFCVLHHVHLQSKATFQGQVGDFSFPKASPLKLCLPSTFMNESGRSVQAILHFYKIPVQEVLVVHDELDFPTGIARLKFGGGSGGHNGIKDIIKSLGSDGFWRLRLGIDHPGHASKVISYVLHAPSAPEVQNIQDAIQHSIEVMKDFCSGDTQGAIQVLHQP